MSEHIPHATTEAASNENQPEATVGKTADQVTAEQPSDAEVAEHLGFDPDPDADDDPDADAAAVPSKAEMWEVIQSQQQTIEDLEATVEDLEETVEQTRETQRKFATDITNAGTTADEAKEIARSASATANQARTQVEDDESEAKAHSLPGDVKPSSSPLDFFANCSTFNVKRRFVEQQNKTNTYRAIEVAKKWGEYAHTRTDGTAIFWTRDDVESALIEVLGESPHRQTVSRVWDTLCELGSDDVETKTRQVGRTQEPTEILHMPMETAESLLEARYTGLDLLDADGGTMGGVTPVVTEPETASA